MGNVNTKKEENNPSYLFKKKSKEFVDKCINYGSLIPQGIYTTEPEYDIEVVRQFIMLKKLAPFYKGLPDYVSNPFPSQKSNNSTTHENELKNTNTTNTTNTNQEDVKRNSITNDNDLSASTSTSTSTNDLFSKEEFFKYPVECPICFLYYPRNTNYTRCCDQPICTECFIQIKRTYSNPEPTCCPYCVHPNFGVSYFSPDSDEYLQQYEILIKTNECNDPKYKELITQGSTPGKKRRNTISHTDPQVVTSDDIYPGWIVKYEQYVREQQRLEEIRMRRHNSHLRALATENTNAALLNAIFHIPIRTDGNHSNGSSHRSSGNRDLLNFRVVGSDIEELMVLEAIRRSLAEAEQAEQNNTDQIVDVTDGENQVTSTTSSTATNDTTSTNSHNSSNNELLQTNVNNNINDSNKDSSVNNSIHKESSNTFE